MPIAAAHKYYYRAAWERLRAAQDLIEDAPVLSLTCPGSASSACSVRGSIQIGRSMVATICRRSSEKPRCSMDSASGRVSGSRWR